MTTERIVRFVAGGFIIVSLVLAQLHSKYWLLFAAFVGANLFQSAFSRWCPMMWMLGRAGLRSG